MLLEHSHLFTSVCDNCVHSTKAEMGQVTIQATHTENVYSQVLCIRGLLSTNPNGLHREWGRIMRTGWQKEEGKKKVIEERGWKKGKKKKGEEEGGEKEKNEKGRGGGGAWTRGKGTTAESGAVAMNLTGRWTLQIGRSMRPVGSGWASANLNGWSGVGKIKWIETGHVAWNPEHPEPED